MPIPDLEIVCVDCGGTCYPLGWHPEDGEVEDGTVIPYRCKDCLDRWDIVIGDWEDDANPDRPSYQDSDIDAFRGIRGAGRGIRGAGRGIRGSDRPGGSNHG